MAVAELFLLAIFGTAVHGHSLRQSPDERTLDKYLGTWYNIGMILQYPIQLEISCPWSHATRLGDSNERFEDINKMLLNYSKKVRTAVIRSVGRVIDSEFHITMYAGSKLKRAVFTVKRYNDGEQIIAHVKGNQYDNVLISRTPNAPQDVIEEFEKLADSLGASTLYFSHENCTYA